MREYNQENVKSMISIIERQIQELEHDLELVEHHVSRTIIQQAIKDKKILLVNTQDKLKPNI